MAAFLAMFLMFYLLTYLFTYLLLLGLIYNVCGDVILVVRHWSYTDLAVVTFLPDFLTIDSKKLVPVGENTSLVS